MSWEETGYAVNKILKSVEMSKGSGIPPKNMVKFGLRARDSSVKITCAIPSDTIIENQTICTVKGVKIVRKTASAPIGPDDGTLVADLSEKGTVFTLIDSGKVNGVTYYYGFFPYSDHNVYNIAQVNILSCIPSAITYWAFDQNFADKDPATTISYPTGHSNSNFEPMMTNEGNGASTAGDWGEFLTETLMNYPYMVKTTGKADYQMSSANYAYKVNGKTASDYANTSYAGGAFSWLNKIYTHEEYSSDGESREVTYADGPADGFVPMGFYDPDQNELEGVWLPMGYMDASGRTLVSGTTPIASNTCDQEKAIIDKFSSRAVFLGGPMLNLLRDLEYMLFKSTDIQKSAGYGRCGAGSQKVIANAKVANGNVPGWYGNATQTTMNKYFHSQLLGSYQQYIRDPYTLLINGTLYASPYYIYDLTGAKLINTGKTFATSGGWYYASKLRSLGDQLLGSFQADDNAGSTSTGLCDGHYISTTITATARRLGACGGALIDGPAPVDLSCAASAADWSGGVGVLLLPPAGYAPEVQ
jgi:hypothetical protein